MHPGGIPNLPDDVTQEAYSHEVSSAGFWAGGGPADPTGIYGQRVDAAGIPLAGEWKYQIAVKTDNQIMHALELLTSYHIFQNLNS